MLHFFVAPPSLHKEVEATDQSAKDEPPVAYKKFTDGNHNQGWRWQVRTERAEYFLEGRDHENHDDRNDHESHHKHRDRIHQR